MAQVTYRGVSYDTETRLQQQQTQQPQQKQLVYRGIEVKRRKVMLVTAEILVAAVAFLALIYVEAKLLYSYK